MPSYDRTKPVSVNNWPKGLKMPPLRRQASNALEKSKPQPEDDQHAPWWRRPTEV